MDGQSDDTQKSRLLLLTLCQKAKGEGQVSLMSRIFTWLYIDYTREKRKGKFKRCMIKFTKCRSICGEWDRVITTELPHVWQHMCSQRFPLWPLVTISDYDGYGWFKEFENRLEHIAGYIGTKEIPGTHDNLLKGGIMGGKSILFAKLRQMRNAENLFSDPQRLCDRVGNDVFNWLTHLATGITGGERVALKFAVSMIQTDSFYLPGSEKAMAEILVQNVQHGFYFFSPQKGGSTPAILLHYHNAERGCVRTLAFNVSYCTLNNEIEMRCSASKRFIPSGLNFRDAKGDAYTFATLSAIEDFVEASGIVKSPLYLRNFELQDA